MTERGNSGSHIDSSIAEIEFRRKKSPFTKLLDYIDRQKVRFLHKKSIREMATRNDDLSTELKIK